MPFTYLGLGTNLGDKTANLDSAIEALSRRVGKVRCASSYRASLPWGFDSVHEFLNAVVLVETELEPLQLLDIIREIEWAAGRVREKTTRYQDRPIDIDILFYDDRIIDYPELKIPHPLIAERDFVLIPLAEIAPELEHPVLKLKIKDLVRKP